MRVGELGSNVKFEVITVRYPVVSESDHPLPSLLDDILLEEGFE